MKKVFIFIVLTLIVLLGFGCSANKATQPTAEITESTGVDEEKIEITNFVDEITETVEKITENVVESKSPKESEQEEVTDNETVSITPVEEITEEVETRESTEQTNSLYADDYNYPGFHGRLHIPSVGIDVALYFDYDQSVADRTDSAVISYWGELSRLIADHANQQFGKLFNVEVGTTGYIQLTNGDIINIKCLEVLNGHNTGTDLTDGNYCSIPINEYDYIMYTCRDSWQNVLICKWDCY